MALPQINLKRATVLGGPNLDGGKLPFGNNLENDIVEETEYNEMISLHSSDYSNYSQSESEYSYDSDECSQVSGTVQCPNLPTLNFYSPNCYVLRFFVKFTTKNSTKPENTP